MIQASKMKGLFRRRRSPRRSSSDTANSGSRQVGYSGTEYVITTLPSNVEPNKMSSQDNDTPDINANEPDVPEQAANQETVISDVGRYRRSRMKRTSKLNRSASTSSADTPRASLSTCSASSTSSDRSCVSLDGVDIKSLRAISFARRNQSSSLPRTRSETRFGPKSRTRLYKRSLRHQSSDSVVIIGKMDGEGKISRSPSDTTMSSSSSVEQVVLPKPKTGPHPKKKMLRSHSESAIDVSMLRRPQNMLQDDPRRGTPKSGIVCSNEDLMKILSDAKKHKFSRKRNNTIISRLDATPELPQETSVNGEAETCLDENLGELPSPKSSTVEAPPITNSAIGPRSWATRHHSMRITNNHSSAADLNTRAMDLQGWSPKHISATQNNNTTTANFPAKIFSRGEKRNSNGYCRVRSYPTTAQCPTELEPMLGEVEVESDQDDNGNTVEVEVVEKPVITTTPTEPTPKPVTKCEAEDQPSTSQAPAAPQTIVCTGFDPELLGQAIERHLSIAKVSPTHESKPDRSRSGSIKNMWTQNRISNLVTRFPFRRENSTTAAV
ncbi:uncharacterized protein [Asterias amurensis]|uniref:uncharacterized protein n=1 Tax=Asterias amurensis TaxID=7602 RepID=UPI003AB1C79C